MPALACSLVGLYKFIVAKDGVTRLETPWFRNTITLTGLDRIGIGDFITQCQVGTGTTEAADTDTELDELLGTSTDLVSLTSGARASSDYGFNIPHGYGQFLFHFAEDEVTGTITEVGSGWSTGLFSRHVLTAPVTVLAGETLDVIYELQNAASLEGEGGYESPLEFLIGEDLHGSWFRGPAHLDDGSTTLGWGVTGTQLALASWPLAFEDPTDTAVPDQGWVNGGPPGTGEAAASVTPLTYTPGNYYQDFEVAWDTTAANFTNGISAFLLPTEGLGCFQMFGIGEDYPEGDPPIWVPIRKTNTQAMTLTFRVSWRPFEEV